MRRPAVLIAALCIVITDRLTKNAALSELAGGRSIDIIPGAFRLSLVMNRGVAFGLFKDQTPVFIAISAAVILAVILYLFRRSDIDSVSALGMTLILGGAAGNLWDRVAFGYVVDFLDFRVWPVFNMADSAITIGAILFIVKFLCIRSSQR